eukprot:SAG11_NODE_2916_length_2840_cov_13.306457_5_plen_51_part_00
MVEDVVQVEVHEVVVEEVEQALLGWSRLRLHTSSARCCSACDRSADESPG